ncbi:hypothetical protein P3W45_001129 [Vairimorpha bombi]
MSENGCENIILPLISGSTENQVFFFRQKQILRSSQECLYCSVRMNIVIYNKIKDKQVRKCQNKECSHLKTTLSIRTGSFFISKHELIVNATEDIVIRRKILELIYESLRQCCERYYDANLLRLGAFEFEIIGTSYSPGFSNLEIVNNRCADTLLPIIGRVCMKVR